ncbi:hypothetical protein [Halopiger aswanensis]|uniref:Uncharacterized protein n=1 Tax=Halopiger aswanensis TaxID=148449 RepID=A0A419WH40_9EURY|nr:hypothetical protein [Halopiger aswanensis]RKD94788.1 hypothetical protein ATJ93_1631 [Halopiger aswanensis]
MNHPYGRCQNCGERLYEHIEGGYRCPNCETQYAADDLDFDLESGSESAPDLEHGESTA